MVTSTLLVVTDRSIEKNQLDTLKAFGMDLLNWKMSKEIKPSDYEVVILNTRITETNEDLLQGYEFLFESMRPEIETLLQAGGVVFVLAGTSMPMRIHRGKVVETNYDFLPKYLLKTTCLSTSESRAGARYETGK